MSEKPTLHQIQNTVATFLAAMAPVFTPGCTLTFFMRHPDIPSAHLIISDDTIGGVRKGLDQLEKSLDPASTTISTADPDLAKAKERNAELQRMVFGLTNHAGALTEAFLTLETVMKSTDGKFIYNDDPHCEDEIFGTLPVGFLFMTFGCDGACIICGDSILSLAQNIKQFSNEKPS